MRVVVVGGGLTGLATALGLTRAGHDVQLFEASGRAGGAVASIERDGFVMEQGAGSLRGAHRDVYQLLADAGVTDAVIPSSPQASNRFLLQGGQLVGLPKGPGGLFGIPRLGRRGALRLLQEPLRPARRWGGAEETVHAFLARRLGRRAADALADPLMAGIFGGDPRRLEVASAFPDWVQWERDHGSLVLGAIRSRTTPPHGMPSGTFSLRGGVGTLVDALVDQLGDRLHLHTEVTALHRDRTGLRVIADGATVDADHVVLTCPLEAARQLLPDAPAGWLADIPVAPIAAVHLAYDGPSVPDGLPGFGYLVHSGERTDLLGCLWVSGAFPEHAPAGQHLVRFMMGGARDPSQARRTDEQLIEHARSLMQTVQGVRAEPLFAQVNRAIIPQYPPGYARRLRLLGQLDPRVDLAGWWWGQLGVAGSARAAADLVRRLRNR